MRIYRVEERMVNKMGSNRRKIIYVDDVNFQLLSIKETLKNRYEIYPAISSDRMFEILEHVTPELILLDINMPDVDGYETIARLKADARYTNIPVVFLTAQGSQENIVKAMKLGAVDFLAKPLSIPRLVECVEHQLCHRRKTG